MKITLVKSRLVAPVPVLPSRQPPRIRIGRRRFFATATTGAGLLLLPPTLLQSSCDNPALQEAGIKLIAKLLNVALDELIYYVKNDITGSLTVENQSPNDARGTVDLELLHSQSLNLANAATSDEYVVPPYTENVYAFTGVPADVPDDYRVRLSSADNNVLSDTFQVK